MLPPWAPITVATWARAPGRAARDIRNLTRPPIGPTVAWRVVTVLVDATGLGVRRPDRALFEGLSVTVTDGDRVGVVGITGTGKSTLLRVLAGTVTPDAGEVRRGRGVRI